MPSTGLPAAATGSGRCRGASSGPGSFGGPGTPLVVFAPSALILPNQAQHRHQLLVSEFFVRRSGALQGHRNFSTRGTPSDRAVSTGRGAVGCGRRRVTQAETVGRQLYARAVKWVGEEQRTAK